jgi:hypothetical protein
MAVMVMMVIVEPVISVICRVAPVINRIILVIRDSWSIAIADIRRVVRGSIAIIVVAIVPGHGRAAEA